MVSHVFIVRQVLNGDHVLYFLMNIIFLQDLIHGRIMNLKKVLDFLMMMNLLFIPENYITILIQDFDTLIMM